MTSVKVVKDNWREVSVRLERNIGAAVRDTTLAVETQIRTFIGDPPGGGSPSARAAGRRGLIDTGNYLRSWTTAVDRTSGEVGSPVEYGPYLEYGTRNAPAYPHIVPAATKVADRVREFFGRLDR